MSERRWYTGILEKMFPSNVDLLDVTYCDDNIICSDSEVWTYLVVAGENFGITTYSKLEEHAEKIDSVFETVTDVPIHIRLTTMPFDSEGWLKMMLDHHAREVENTKLQPSPAYNRFMRSQADTLRLKGAKSFRRYIGVYLGKRYPKHKKRMGDGTVLNLLYKQMDKVSGVGEPKPTKSELEYFHAKAKQIRDRFISSQNLRARGATEHDMWALYHHALRLGINQPPSPLYGKTWGADEAASMAAIVDTHDPKAMKIQARNKRIKDDRRAWAKLKMQGIDAPEPSPILESYVVGMSVKLPDRDIPAMWVEQLKETGIPVDISFRFVVKSKQRAADDAEKQNESIRKESDLQQSVGAQDNSILRIKQESEKHAYETSNGQVAPQITLTTRVFVHAPTKDAAVENSEEVIRIMHDTMKTDLNPLFGASYSYWRESIPGQKVMKKERTTNHHETHTDIGALTMSGVFTTVEVGHKYGYFVGFYGATPVFFDPTLLGKQGKASAIFLNGSLGSGKSVASMQIIDPCRLRSYFTVIIDPKRDQLASLALQGRGHTKLWSLNTEGKPGMLDPFTLISREVNPNDPDRDTQDKADELWRSETISLVDMVITDTLHDPLTRNQRARLNDLVNLELDRENPSMYHLLELMKAGELGKTPEALHLEKDSQEHMAMKREMSDLHSNLWSVANTSIGRLVFGEKTEQVKMRYHGVNTIIINTNGLTLPAEGQKPSNQAERNSSMVYGLLATYVGQLLINDKSIPGFFKLLVVDEFNVARDNIAFKSQIKRIVSMGRSLGITTLLLDQSMASAADEKLFGNKLGGRWVGRSDLTSRQAAATALGYANDPEAFEALVKSMPNPDRDAPGRALLSLPADDDIHNTNNIKVIQFDISWNYEYRAFESNISGQEKDTRAAIQRYETDANGIHYDPMLRDVEVELVESEEVAMPKPTPAQEPVLAGVSSGSSTDWI